MLSRISVSPLIGKKPGYNIHNEFEAISYFSLFTADRVKAKAIVCITEKGNTVMRVASYRPLIPIIAITMKKDLLNKLSLIRGVSALYLEKSLV